MGKINLELKISVMLESILILITVSFGGYLAENNYFNQALNQAAVGTKFAIPTVSNYKVEGGTVLLEGANMDHHFASAR